VTASAPTSSDAPPAGAPELSIVLVTPSTIAPLRGTLDHLQRQTVRDRIELVLVGPHPDSFDDVDPTSLRGFAGWTTVAAGTIREAERASAAGVAKARAPLVALLENHVFPEAGWAQAVMQAHRGPWAAVASVIDNANPTTSSSWVEHLLSYGFHDGSVTGGEVARPSRNNLTWKREVLVGFGDRLAELLKRDGGLVEEVGRSGGRWWRESSARLLHLNVSLLVPTLALRVHSARASAAKRARVEGWTAARRWLYVAGSPAFPLLRVRALMQRLRARGEHAVPKRTWPLFGVVLLFDSLGQAIGFAFGAGESAERAGRFDLDRLSYVTKADRARLTTPAGRR
jgi:hypothetical protein